MLSKEVYERMEKIRKETYEDIKDDLKATSSIDGFKYQSKKESLDSGILVATCNKTLEEIGFIPVISKKSVLTKSLKK